MSLFDKKGNKGVRRPALRRAFKEAPPSFGGAKKYGPEAREKMAKDIFPKKYGKEVTPEDYRKAIREFSKSREAKGYEGYKKRQEALKKIDYLKKLGGM